jgi:formylglycine-generating enzyme required for sulfatase activity
MLFLPGTTFKMGTDYAEAFPLDGEGPVREVTLDPFRIDACPVTNDRFREFVSATQ